MRRQSRALHDRLTSFAATRRAASLMFVWAVAEAIVWPIIPDALLFPLIVARPRLAARLTACSAIGSALSGIALVLASLNQPASAAALLGKLPLVFDWQIQEVTQLLGFAGPAAFWGQPISGVPFKVWGIIAGVLGLDPWQVIPTFATARTLRMIAVAAVGVLLGQTLHRWIRDHAISAAVGYLIVFGIGWTLTLIPR